MSLNLDSFSRKEKISAIGLMGFRCDTIEGGYSIVDEIDGEEGFNIQGTDLDKLLDETIENFAEPDNT